MPERSEVTETSATHRAAPPAVTEIVQQMGSWFASLGVPRAAGQMFGYLLACDPPEQSARDISQGTGMSAASVSSSARLLVHMNALAQHHRVGDRKTYYRLRPDFWIEMATAKLAGFAHLAEMGRRTKAAGGLTRTDGLDEMIEFAEFWQTELPRLAGRWERRHETQTEDR